MLKALKDTNSTQPHFRPDRRSKNRCGHGLVKAAARVAATAALLLLIGCSETTGTPRPQGTGPTASPQQTAEGAQPLQDAAATIRARVVGRSSPRTTSDSGTSQAGGTSGDTAPGNRSRKDTDVPADGRANSGTHGSTHEPDRADSGTHGSTHEPDRADSGTHGSTHEPDRADSGTHTGRKRGDGSRQPGLTHPGMAGAGPAAGETGNRRPAVSTCSVQQRPGREGHVHAVHGNPRTPGHRPGRGTGLHKHVQPRGGGRTSPTTRPSRAG